MRAPLITFAACVVVAAVMFGLYVVHRAEISDNRAEAQRKAICAILANIPGHVPPEIANARLVFARPHHPRDCEPIRHPDKTAPKPHAAGPTVVVFPSGGGAAYTPGASPRPSPSRTASPRSSPRPSHSPAPSPSPSPTCSTVQDVLAHPVDCLHL